MPPKTVITPPVTLVGSILTRDEIISHGIIVFDNTNDNNPECFDNTSYNLRLGEKYYKPKIDNYPLNVFLPKELQKIVNEFKNFYIQKN